ncbi:MAG: methanogenesis marker 6 protein [Methanotrichaceae archaeon]|nr:methanogenesis marker 6 protein [Methanotrichaceae archaeon]
MRLTKYIITSPESDIMPSDIAMKIYGSNYDINVKETCFGIIINGEEEAISELLKEIRAMDPNGIFIKDRGFPPGDPRRCRGRRGGGPRPGFYMIEYESKMLPLISKALASEGETKAVAHPPKKKPLDLEKLEAIITTELS